MRIDKLHIRNFLIFKEVDLDLDGVEIVNIIGQHVADRRRSNGSGKTALIEAIRYALFDQTRTTVKTGVVRNGAKNSTVTMQFTVRDKVIKVTRTRTAGGTSGAEVWINGRSAASKIREVNQVVIDHIGVGSALFDLIFFFKQQDQFSFTTAKPAERKAALAKVFRMEHVEQCLVEAKARSAALQQHGDRLQGRADMLQQSLNELPDTAHSYAKAMRCGDALSNLSLEYDRNAEAIADLDKSLSSIGDTSRELERLWADLEHELGNLSDDCQNLLYDIKQEQIKLQSDDSTVQAVEARVASYEGKVSDATWTEDDKHELDSIGQELIAKRNHMQQHRTWMGTADATAERLRAGFDGKCPSCQQVVPAEHVERVVAECAGKSRVSNEAILVLGQEIEALVKQQQALEQRRDAAQATRGYQDALTEARSQLHAARKQRAARLRTLEDLQERLAMAQREYSREQAIAAAQDDGGTIETLDGIGKALFERKRFLESRQREIPQLMAGLSAKYERVCGEHDRRLEADTQLEAVQADLETYEHDMEVMRLVIDSFGKNGIQAILIENVLGAMEQYANDILEQMHTHFRVEFKTQKETQKGASIETLDIFVLDNGAQRAFETYSGGEKTIINLAIRLSLSRIISALHGVELSCLFLDEVLAALDAVNREEAVRVIAYLSRSFSQCFVISHTDEVKDIIDTSIVVQRHDNHSTITTHGRDHAA